MFSKRFFCAVIVLLVIIGLATATFQGSSSCGIQIHRASGKVLWCESQQDSPGSNQNITIYVAPMNATNNRVAILNFLSLSPIMSTGSSTYASPYLDTESGRIMIVVSTYTHSPSSGMPPFPITTFTGFHILTGSIQDLTSFTTVYTNATAMEQAQATQTWVNGVFLFSVSIFEFKTLTAQQTSLSDTNSVSYKAFVPNNNNGLSLVNIFPYSTITQTSVHAWAMDGSSRLCLSVTADESYIVCRAVSNSSTDLVIHTDANTLTFIKLISDNNGRIFWGEVNGTTSWRVWAANSDKSDTPAVLDRTTNETYVTLMTLYGNGLVFGYDSYSKLVYWTEQILLPSSTEYTFGVFGWDGKTNAVVTYFGAANVSTTFGQICTSNGQMILVSTQIQGDVAMPSSITRRLYHTSPSSGDSPASTLLFTHVFNSIVAPLTMVCDEDSGWAVLGLLDISGQIGSAVSAVRIDNTTTLSIQFSADVAPVLEDTSIAFTDGIIGYNLQDLVLSEYDLFFYTLIPDDVIAVPSDGSNNSPSSPNTNPSTTPVNGPSGKVSFANQIVPLMYIASLLAYLFF